jgi:D-alanine-D-alanine ligase-like ATP-grasp enzyme
VAGGKPAHAEYALLDAPSDWADVVQQLGLPLFVKPANEGPASASPR